MRDKLTKVLHAFSALADLGEEISETRDFEEMVSSALHVVLGALGVRNGAVGEYDREAGSLRFVAARGTSIRDASAIKLSGEMPSTEPDASGSSSTNLARIEELISGAVDRLSIEHVSALVVRDELVGAILLGAKASGEPFTDDERELVRALGRHIGVGLHNHRLLREVERRAGENRKLYDDLRGIYSDTVRAFAAAIDCKDKYTQGHSERVGKYSEIIARELGWTEEQVEGMAVAGYLHDIGKLVVDRDIINAPYKIDARKSSELNRHPVTGYEILLPIRHPYADIPEVARYHHERVDGHGYPEGLKGDEIPLCAKIATLADSFDAMTTDRPYKRRRTFDEVVEDLRRNSGKQFDPVVVIALCRALLKEAIGETRPRRMLRMLGKDYLPEGSAVPALQELITQLEAGAFVTAGQQ
jgi:response regulator RpfG family c-di-GMP phosphodiesterase